MSTRVRSRGRHCTHRCTRQCRRGRTVFSQPSFAFLAVAVLAVVWAWSAMRGQA